jgi:hypothetical protein
MSKTPSFYYCILLLVATLGWSQTDYTIDVQLDTENESLIVSQTLTFQNPSEQPLSKIYLSDWANSYQGTPSPLANHLANQFNRSFYLSAKSKLGYTRIQELKYKQKEVTWSRLEDQLDLIQIDLDNPIAPKQEITLTLLYVVKIPDDKFTGLGINANERYFLRDFFISLTPFRENNWLLHSNLGLRDNSHLSSNYSVNWTYPDTYYLASNLKQISNSSSPSDGLNISQWKGFHVSSPDFIFNTENEYETFTLRDGFTIVTDILPSKNSEVNLKASLEKIHQFVRSFLLPLDQKKLLVLRKDYAKNPLFGITEALSFLNPFSDAFIYETKFIKAYLATYIHELFRIDKRKDHWIPGGIQTYVIMKYVETFYPDSKFLGALNEFKFLGIRPFKGYSAAQIGFIESFSFIYEWAEHGNRQQSDTLGREQLTKSNELLNSPYHVGSGLFYLDQYLGKNILSEGIYEFSKTRGQQSFETILKEKSNENLDWFFENYLSDREAFDLYIKNILRNKQSLFVTISEKNNKSVPFKLDLVKDDSLVKEQWIHHKGKDTIIQLKREDIDFLAINSNRFLPEKNRLNNWKYLKSYTGFKPLKFTFYGDSENLKRNQIFYHPISDFNVYDGFTGGMRIYNTRVKNQPFELDLHPQYSFKENDFVGFFRTRYRFINHKSKNYLNQAFITGKSYHYNTNLRYTSIQPSFSMYFRPLDLRSNKRQLLNISWYNVFRDRDPEVEVNPDYSVVSLLHAYNNEDAVNKFSTSSNLEVANKFGKIHFTSRYRKLFPSGRYFALRLFAGKFLWNNTTEKDKQFFDFNLNRSPDYLFRYDYLGRSDESGIWSQQFVPAEGGFKSFFEESSANNYMASLNASIGIWKWIEFYGDIGALKNIHRSAVGYFDSGIKFNLVPDYFEIFFPLYSSNGFEPTQARYATKIRFIFSPRLSTLSSLFTRKWF